jgi:hypothetical protein
MRSATSGIARIMESAPMRRASSAKAGSPLLRARPGALNLRGFYLANPNVPLLGLLPLVGVPAFIAVHIMTLWALYARRSVLVPSST